MGNKWKPFIFFIALYTTQSLGAQTAITDSLEQALKTAIQKKDKAAEANTLRALGTNQAREGIFLLALDNAQRAMDIYESLGQPIDIAKCYRVMMIVHYSLHNMEKLEDFAEKSLAIGLEKRDTAIISYAYSALSLAYQERKEYKRDLDINQKALALAEKSKAPLGMIQNNLSTSYATLGDFSNALKYARLSAESSKDDVSVLLPALLNEVGALALSGNVSEAEQKIQKVEEMVKNLKINAFERYVHLLHYFISEAKKDYKQALQHYVKYHQLDSLIISQTHHMQYAQAETAYQTKKKEQQNDRLTNQVQKQRFVFGGVAVGLLLIGSFFYFQRNQLKIKNKLLEVEQALAHEKLLHAEQELAGFTHSLREKNETFEKMKAALDTKNASDERDKLTAQLAQASIITEEQWRDFRQKFERVYPNFFAQIQTAVTDITESEKRFVALTKLDLTGNEIAAMLGVSPESVIKTRYRFRKKLEDGNLKELLANI
jgi:tetratricopeptide (TPR) repeat protein/DNA-binding CsgD family transcriptional regulator